MNKYFLLLLYILIQTSFVSCSDGIPSNDSEKNEENDGPAHTTIPVADFESEKTTPYMFRFGNRGNQNIDITYKPRWMYSLEVIENPVKDNQNTSQYVLRYTSMEARDFGVKLKFNRTIQGHEIDNVQLKIYQNKNVIGKPDWKNTTTAKQQCICVKLLTEYWDIHDYHQDAGVLLSKSTQEFREENQWKTFTFNFDPADYSHFPNLQDKAFVGLAILPTFKSETTLAETAIYECFIDDIAINGTIE